MGEQSEGESGHSSLELELEINDNTSIDHHKLKKNSSIDDYAKSRGSKSNSKDINISDDIEDIEDFGVKQDGSIDLDIDVGDYDWNSFKKKKTLLNQRKFGKKKKKKKKKKK